MAGSEFVLHGLQRGDGRIHESERAGLCSREGLALHVFRGDIAAAGDCGLEIGPCVIDLLLQEAGGRK